MPAVSPIAVPGRTIARPRRARSRASRRSVRSTWRRSRARRSCVDGSVAPPCTLFTSPSRVEQVEVAADGHVADAELRREVAHPRRPVALHVGGDQLTAPRAGRSCRVATVAACTRGLRASVRRSSMPRIIRTRPTRSQQIRSSFARRSERLRWFVVRNCVFSLDFAHSEGPSEANVCIRRPTPLGGTHTCHVQHLVVRRGARRHRRARSARSHDASCSPEPAPRSAPGSCSAAPDRASPRRPACAAPAFGGLFAPAASRGGVGDGHVRQQLLRRRPQGGVPGDDRRARRTPTSTSRSTRSTTTPSRRTSPPTCSSPTT